MFIANPLVGSGQAGSDSLQFLGATDWPCETHDLITGARRRSVALQTAVIWLLVSEVLVGTLPGSCRTR